ncbi:MAG: response regulator [Thermodesulfobacteriota bacterium]|nr:response regulator [Thermodesulfobacteriota bacterium]
MKKQIQHENEEMYGKFLEANPDPVIVYDMKGKVVYFNPAFHCVFGWTFEECLGKKMDFFVPDENWPETQMMINKGLDRQNFSGIESRRYTKDGDILDVSISGAVQLDADGSPVRSVVNLRDITQQKRLEGLLQQGQKMEAIGTLAGGIAHDFNNLLMGIQGYTSLILLDTDSNSPHYDKLKNIEQLIKNGAELTKQLLGFARGGKYHVKPTDINEVMKKSSQMFGRTKREITIHTKYQDNIWAVEIDQRQIDQVLLNLYVNAWQAMPGGGELFLQTENIILDEYHTGLFNIKAGKYIKISVIDTGIGMDHATMQRVFDPFFTTKDMGRGTGLGLASAYGIIKNHQGIIDVSSKKGEGTAFDIYLPASEKDVIRTTRLTQKLLTGTETILLVDDEEAVIDTGEKILEALGYKVFIAREGEEALELYKKNKVKIDLVILDMIMPKMGGGEVYDRMKELNPDIKVLLSSGYSIDGQASEILERGCDGFIQKPFNIKQLSQSIRGILDRISDLKADHGGVS